MVVSLHCKFMKMFYRCGFYVKCLKQGNIFKVVVSTSIFFFINDETVLNQRCLHRVFNNETGNKSQCLSIVYLSTELISQQCSSIKLWFLKNVCASTAKMFKIFLSLQTEEQYLNIEFINGKSLKFVVSLPRVSKPRHEFWILQSCDSNLKIIHLLDNRK